MKRKLIVTLVAAALELYAATTAHAQAGSCLNNALSLANGATPVRTGPLNPTNGFPEYVTDSTGLTVQRCLDPVFCFASPVVPTDPFSIQIGSGVEAFYWGATNVVSTAGGNKVLTYAAAAETAFLHAGPNGEPINGSQFPFLRLRFTMGVPVDGLYTVVHPYGVDTFTVIGATGARDVFFTVDKGLAPNATVQGAVAPFLKAVPDGTFDPTKFLGNGGAAAAPTAVTGSPCGVEFVQVTGTDNAGNPVDFGDGPGVPVVSSLWGIQGQIFDGKVQTPLNPTRLSYSRTIAGGGQIDSFGVSTTTAALTVKDGPTIAAGTGRIPLPVTLDHTAFSATEGTNSGSVVVADASAVPAIVALTAADPTAVVPTDPTTLNLHLVDYVDITQADYDPATGTLAVTASSADARTNPTLTLRDFSTFTAGNPVKLVTTVAPPAVVHVDSAAGGSAAAQVRVIAAVAPAAPTGLAAPFVSSGAVRLTWTDASNNESGFKIYQVDAAGVKLSATPLATTVSNVTQFDLRSLVASTTYRFVVAAFNGVGETPSTLITVTTPALPVAPATVNAPAVSPTTSLAVNLSWAASTDPTVTGYNVLRRTGAAPATFTAVNAAPIAATSLVDTARATNTTYTYQVQSVRVVGPFTDVSAVTQSTSLTTPALPAAKAAPTFTNNTGTSLTVNWPASVAPTTGYIVYRAPSVGGVAGTYATVSGTLPLATTSFVDTVTPGTAYFYRINAVGWANYTTGLNGVPVSVTTANVVTLNAPTSLAVSNANSPVLTWVDASTGETNYRVLRASQTVNADGSITAAAATIVTSTVAANGTTFTDTGASRDTTYKYSVAALNGATQGPLATSGFALAATAGLPTANRPTLTRSLNAGVARVTVTWAQPGGATSVGGYEIQRCVSTGAGSSTCAATSPFAKVAGTAVNTTGTVDGRGTATFADNTVARATNYVYRMRTVGGTGTGFLGAFGPTQTVSTQ